MENTSISNLNVRRERARKPFTAKHSPFNQLPCTVQCHQVPDLLYVPLDLSSCLKELARRASKDPIQLQKWKELYPGSKYAHVPSPESQIRIVRVKDPDNQHLQAFLAENDQTYDLTQTNDLPIHTLFTDFGERGTCGYFRFPAHAGNPRDSNLAKRLGLHVQGDGEIMETPPPFEAESRSCKFDDPWTLISEIPDLLRLIFIYKSPKGGAE
jgi:hypothetical protein